MYKGISEIYPCLQGEGSRVGVPSILIRTLGCNLRCSWCDTPYTSWKVEKGTFVNSDILPIIEKYPHITDVIISGGEPTIYPNIEELISICKESNKIVTIETNGTKSLPIHVMQQVDLISLSPKLKNSTPLNTPWEKMHNAERLRTDVLLSWINEAKDYQLKFVVKIPEDIKEISLLVSDLDISRKKVFLMPEGVSQEQLQAKRLWLADLCINEGYRYCERIHVVIYGDRRGV